MAYSNPRFQTYTRSVATTTTAWTVAPPPGATQCRVVDINASVTTSFVGTTTAANIAVGVPSNPSVGGVLTFGTIGSPSQAGTVLGWTSQYVKGSNPVVGTLDLTGTANPAAVTSPFPAALEALGPVSITFTASTGTPAGAATVDVTLAWF
jgi:hypothetical protein